MGKDQELAKEAITVMTVLLYRNQHLHQHLDHKFIN